MSSDQSDKVGGWKKWSTRFLLGVVVLAALAVVIQFIRIKLSRAGLERSLAEMAKAGEPVHVEDVFMPPVDPAKNRLNLWRDAHSHVEKADAEGNSLSDLLSYDVPLSVEHAKQVHSLAQANLETLRGVDAAISSPYPCTWSLDLTKPGWLQFSEYGAVASDLSAALCVAALDAHNRGDDAAAVSLLIKVDTLSQDFKRYPGFMGSVIGYGRDAMLADTATRIAADWNRLISAGTPAKLPAADIRSIIASLLEETTRANDLRSAQFAQRVIDADEPLSFVGSALMHSGAAPSFANGNPSLKYIFLPNVTNTANDFLRFDTEAIRASNGTTWIEARRNVDAIKPVEGLFALAGDHAWTVWLKATFSDRATRRVSSVALAISLFVNEHHGEFPKSLDELAPRYIASIPSDPMTSGQPLRYKLGAAPILYSVGPDGKDDGGDDREPLVAGGHEFKDIVVHLLPK